MNIKEAIAYSKQRLSKLYDTGENGAITELLLVTLLGIDRTNLRINEDKKLTKTEELSLREYLLQLETGAPLQYVLGETLFYNLIFKVNKSVLIPRPETEELVLAVLKWMNGSAFKVLEIGAGSGCIAIALKKNNPLIEMVSIDISEEALTLARENAVLNQVQVDFKNLDFLDEKECTSLTSFDIIVSNPPYILPEEASKMECNVLDFEPHLALFVSNNDPLQFYKAISNHVSKPRNLVKSIFLELNQQFAAQTKSLFDPLIWSSTIIKDINNNQRILQLEKFNHLI
ncbi:MAG TPA: peptide chain release factor N(5)-glutamine methyltransferase [Edaphocola sp.]|nr:peptide chain release factor N(5)-glutamine methyltransferase [Edaphocola sp.]